MRAHHIPPPPHPIAPFHQLACTSPPPVAVQCVEPPPVPHRKYFNQFIWFPYPLFHLQGGVVAEAVHNQPASHLNGEGSAIAVIAPPASPLAQAQGNQAQPVHPVTISQVSGCVNAHPATATHQIIPACQARASQKAHHLGIVTFVAIAPAAPAAPAVAPEALPPAPHPLAIASV